MSTFDPVDQRAKYEARLVDVVRGQATVRAAHDVELDQLVEIETAIGDIADNILAPTGIWLDFEGSVLNVDRDGMDDTDFAAALELRKQAMRSHGTVPDILALADAISNAFETSPPATAYLEPAALEFMLTMTLSTQYHALAKRLLTDAKPAGRQGSVQVEASPSIGFRAGAAALNVGILGGSFTLI